MLTKLYGPLILCLLCLHLEENPCSNVLQANVLDVEAERFEYRIHYSMLDVLISSVSYPSLPTSIFTYVLFKNAQECQLFTNVQ